MEAIIQIITNIIPDSLFLLAAAGFLGVIMAFLVPLSVEIISKVSAKYNSDIIVRLYKNSFINRIFTDLLLFTLAAMIATRFFVSPEFSASIIGKGIMWILLFLALIITALVGYLIRRIDRFISDDAMPLRILYKDLHHLLTINKQPSRYNKLFGSKLLTIINFSTTQPVDRPKFIQTLEGIGDILTYQIGRHNETLVSEGLEKIDQSIRDLYQVRSLDPTKFSQLVYDEEFQSIIHQQDYKDIHHICFSNPDKFLDGLATAFNQLKRIYRTSLEQQNSEITQLVSQKMNHILYYLACQKDNALAVELLLKKLIECLQLSLRHTDEFDNQGIHWYSDSLNQQPHIDEGSYNLEYLDIYNRYLMNFISHIISQGHDRCFFAIIKNMTTTYAIPNLQRGKVWGYHYLLKASDLNSYRSINEELGIQRQVRHLAISEAYLDTLEQLQQWLDKFNQLSQTIEPHLNTSKQREAQRLNLIIKTNAIKHLKRRRLLRVAYAIAAHCLLNGKPSYILYLWEQSSLVEPNLAIVPNSVQQVLDDYFLRTRILSTLDQGGFSIEKYFRRYYIFLLVRNLQLDSSPYMLPYFDTEQLNMVSDSIDELLSTIEDLMKDSSSLSSYGLKPSLLTKKIPIFLNTVKKEVTKQLHHHHKSINISQKKRADYRKQMLNSWQHYASLRELFTNYLQAYTNHSDQQLSHKPRGWGIEELVNKSLLVGNLDPIQGIGARHGRSIANSENSFLFDALAEACSWSSQKNFDKILSVLAKTEDPFIISTRWTLANFLLQQDNFTLSQPTETKTSRISAAESLTSFSGYYDFDEYTIPVFVIDYAGSGHQMLVLSRHKIGKIIQLPFYSITGRKHRDLVDQIFYFKMEDIASSPRLVRYYLNQDLSWLKEKGTVKAQREYLRELVLIKILENLGFEKANNFVGYRITIKGNGLSPLVSDQTGLLPV